jgi:hypothetical protein
MLLFALKKLGASDERLVAAFNEHKHALETYVDVSKGIAITDINESLGDSRKYASYLKYFQSQLHIFDAGTVIRHALPSLLPGITASAFHALIRLAYAIEASNKKEIAIALAFWCSEHQSFDLCKKLSSLDLENILLTQIPISINQSFSSGIIVDKMNDVAELLKEKKRFIQPQTISLFEIRELCLNAFLEHNNFSLLHTVTGCHAFSVIEPYIENKEVALRELWQAVLIAYLSTKLNYTRPKTKYIVTQKDFSQIIAAALKSNDPHIVKLVYSCWREYLKYKNPKYIRVAQRAISNCRNKL